MRPCLAACCAALCSQPLAHPRWEDCCFIFDLPEGLQEQPEVTPVLDLAVAAVASLANNIRNAHPDAPADLLTSIILELPAYVRLALLQGCKLEFAGMLVLLSSDEQVADCEDSLATFLCSFLKSSVGKRCTAAQVKELKGQLRHQHMSNAFVGFVLPGIARLSLDNQQMAHLMYLRGLKHFDSIPVIYQQRKVPAAWYKPPRTQALPALVSCEITLDVSEAALAAHLQALALFKDGGDRPVPIQGPCVEIRGTSWGLLFASPRCEQPLRLILRPNPTTPEAMAFRKPGIYVEADFCIAGKSPKCDRRVTCWIGNGGFCLKDFGRAHGASQLAWWKQYIVEGSMRFSATLTIQP